ncbi:uncharacterized protein LOC110099868 isoform X2 [Dendrobium catenatum]|uniref:uncharacterized protein LOC110099868 isoform X2 n=1 Tax=Dendrobium catenatum TaxID=906689 RepID=UPI0009F3F249|nr:uncharacterized protein LOC110099868 isoform X2 [Dendrobium catenatum]
MASGCHFFSIPSPRMRPSRRCLRASQSPLPPASALSSSVPETLSEIRNSRVIACLRANGGMLAMEAARAALKGGISVLEVMLSTPDASMAGVVLNVDDAREAMNAGAKFLMSPGTVIEILHEVEGTGVLYIPGVMTPTEVLRAFEAGAKLVKVYPATILGGGKYISALKRPFPHIPIVASQGISIDSINQYIDAGTTAVVLSDAIFDKNAMKQGDFDTIRRLAGSAISKVAQAGIIPQQQASTHKN